MHTRWKVALALWAAVIIFAFFTADEDYEDCDDDEWEMWGEREKKEPKTPLQLACDAHDLDGIRDEAWSAEREDLARALCTAGKRGDLEVVVVLLDTPGIDVNTIHDGSTLIFCAAASADPEIIAFLLDRGADVEIKSMNTRYALYKDTPDLTPLHGLSENRYVWDAMDAKEQENLRRSTLLLLEAGCDVNAATKNGYTLLFDGLRLGLPIVDILLEHGADPNYQDKKGNTPLHFFHTIKDRPDDLKLVMDYGARLDIQSTDDGLTPLHSYVRYHRMNTSLLAPYVTDWSVTDANGNTIIHMAAQSHTSRAPILPEILELGIDVHQRNNDGCQAITLVAEGTYDWEERLDLLLAAGADIEARDYNGRTLLARAMFDRANYGYEEMIPYLVSRGANLNTQDYQGNGVLHYMVRPHRLQFEAFEFLLKNGADPNMTNYKGDTILHRLVANLGTISEETLITAIKKLLEMGVSPVVRNFKGQTPLHMLCSLVSEHHFRVAPGADKAPIDILLDAGLIAGLEIPDHDGILPIHLAATVSEVLVGKLISRGASTTAVTKDGRNLLHIASTARQSNIVGLLLEHNPSTIQASMANATCKRGRTPLHEAARSGRLETVSLLLDAGANASATDTNGKDILYACSEFHTEKELWKYEKDTGNVFGTLAAASVLASDETRPHEPRDEKQPKRGRVGRLYDIESEHDSVSIALIVRVLVAHGAKLTTDDFSLITPITHALDSGSEEMVAEMTRLADTQGLDLRSYHELQLDYSKLRSTHLPPLLERQFEKYISSLDLGYMLLNGHGEELAQALERTPQEVVEQHDQSGLADFISTLARYGYSDLFSRLGSLMTGDDWVSGGQGTLLSGKLPPYLLTASQRSLPNLGIIKTLIEKFHADPNVPFAQGMEFKPRIFYSSRLTADKAYKPGDTILHFLAQGGHWWHVDAIRYLLEHGADPNALNEEGYTPLYAAVSPQHLAGYLQMEIVRVLLDGGADPNKATAADEDGQWEGNELLAVASHDLEIARLLIERGAR
ncbi:ankyrin repeat-containing domain protein [Aspergillus keveii]|uniref:Ankyrin repeat-containing domain protein n=1 Tax=Aspergillus keveii TaxID=714993 RepID=A0ABR4FXC1_9EURO